MKALILPFKLIGRLLSIVIGVVLMIGGLALSLTIVGALIGLPMLLLGFVFTLEGLKL